MHISVTVLLSFLEKRLTINNTSQHSPSARNSSSTTSFCLVLVYYKLIQEWLISSSLERSLHVTTRVSGTTTATTGSNKLDALKQSAEAKAEPKKLSSINLYSRFAFTGAVCCSVTYGGLTPVDV